MKLINGDCLEELPRLAENSIDAVITDVPYGLSFMGKAWDKGVPSVAVLSECLRVLKPGAWFVTTMTPKQTLLARLILNLAEAGFNTDFTSLYWTYASGFPKAHNISKSIDKKEGAVRKGAGSKGNTFPLSQEYVDGDAITDQAKHFDGSYGGFQPKPAVEVIVVAMKPMTEKTFVGQALDNGKGITWLDDCRIPYADDGDKESSQPGGRITGGIQKFAKSGSPELDGIVKKCPEQGRFPANLLVSDYVLDDMKEHNGWRAKQVSWNKDCDWREWNTMRGEVINAIYGDTGGYSRFFSLDAWVERNLPFLIVPKASKREKNVGCEMLEEKVVENIGQLSNSVRGDGSIRTSPVKRNTHPTTKPIKLFSYLLTIFSAPGDTILDPYMGSGTTGVSCAINNRKFVGIELDKDYFEIAEARIKHYEIDWLKEDL